VRTKPERVTAYRHAALYIYIVHTHCARDFRDLKDVVYKCQWRFRPKRAAFMVMLRARKTNVPTALLNMALEEKNPLPEIRSKNVITGVWSCPAFAMYLSDTCKSFYFVVYPPPASDESISPCHRLNADHHALARAPIM